MAAVTDYKVLEVNGKYGERLDRSFLSWVMGSQDHLVIQSTCLNISKLKVYSVFIKEKSAAALSACVFLHVHESAGITLYNKSSLLLKVR